MRIRKYIIFRVRAFFSNYLFNPKFVIYKYFIQVIKTVIKTYKNCSNSEDFAIHLIYIDN